MADDGSDYSVDDQVLDPGRLHDDLTGDLPILGDTDASTEFEPLPKSTHVDFDPGPDTADSSASDTSESHDDIASIFQTGAKSAADIAKAAAGAQTPATKSAPRPPQAPRPPVQPPVAPPPRANPAPASAPVPASVPAVVSPAGGVSMPLVIGGGVLVGGLLIALIAAVASRKPAHNRHRVSV